MLIDEILVNMLKVKNCLSLQLLCFCCKELEEKKGRDPIGARLVLEGYDYQKRERERERERERKKGRWARSTERGNRKSECLTFLASSININISGK